MGKFGSLRKRLGRLEDEAPRSVPETPLMKEAREIDEETGRLDREIAELEAIEREERERSEGEA